MGIDAIAQTETGQPVREVLDPRKYFARVLCLPGLERTACLRFVDPYGDTVFNQSQLPQLISELEALRGGISDQSLRAVASQALQDAKQARWAESVIREYEAEAEQISAGPVLAHFDAVLELARSVQSQPHTYMRFRGD